MVFLPFRLPHAGLQAMRKQAFYWRVVYWYRFALQNDLYNRKPLAKFARFFMVVMAVKALQKGARGHKEEHLHDYNARKANIEATEKAMWDEELAAFKTNVAEVEAAVFRQRMVDWTYRDDRRGFSNVMNVFSFPFRVSQDFKVAEAAPLK